MPVTLEAGRQNDERDRLRQARFKDRLIWQFEA